jgi:hypothetical protein
MICAAVAWRTAVGIKAKSARKTSSKMDMRKFTTESFVKLADVRDGPLRQTIAAVKDGKFDKPNLVFESGEALSLNSTNNRILLRAYGPNSDDWAGKEIELYAGNVEFQGRPLDAVLVRTISPPLKPSERTKLEPEFGSDPGETSKPTKRKAPTKKSGGDADFSDEVPY